MKSVATQTMDEDALPTLKPITPALEAPDLRDALQENVRKSGDDSEAASVITRWAFLGYELINFAVATYMFDNNKTLTKLDEMQVNGESPLLVAHTYLTLGQKACREYASPSRIGDWATLSEGARGYPRDPRSQTTTRRGEIFAAYAGVLYQQDGVRLVQTWIEDLVRYSEGPARPRTTRGGSTLSDGNAPVPAPTQESPQTPSKQPRKRARRDSDPSSQPPAEASGSTSLKHQETSPSRSPSRLLGNILYIQPNEQSAGPSASTATPAAPPSPNDQPDTKNWISLLHERIQKKGLVVSWAFTQDGQSHAPEWTAHFGGESHCSASAWYPF